MPFSFRFLLAGESPLTHSVWGEQVYQIHIHIRHFLIIHHKGFIFGSQRDDSVSKGAGCQACLPESDPGTHTVEGKS